MISLPITKRYNTLNGVQKRGLHQATLFNDQGSEYLITIGIGTPIQNFTLSLDTGSADLWVPSIECPTEQCPLARFNASESSSFQRINSSLFHVQYGIGSVNGTYGRDEIYLGEAHVSQQQFGLASSTHDLIVVTSEKTNEISNGIFGLGHPSLTTSKEKYEPFLYQLAKQGKIDQAMFSISMGARHHDGWSGEMLIGGINNDKHVGEIQYAAVMENSTYWMVGGQSIQLIEEDKVTMNETFDGVRGMIIDTGTTLTYVDHPLADRIVQSVVGGQNNVALDQMSGTYIVNCQAENLSKDNQVHILLENDIVLEIPVKDLIIPLDGKTIQEATQCMFGIAPWMTTGTSAKMNEKGWILIGDSVLRSTYLVFDMKKNQIGFAKAAHLQEMMQSYANSVSPPSLAFLLFSVITLTLT
ncbi:aspartic peptidase domain-containing protein [Mucor mucedo]|uniref:aspartic peptidase domain-containing protein n=1 Tax=Mucor mucedo TaxID=29922 RepID=UPI002220FA62|nr:aspartic peptidase domain-containing protein [Mucor mucedo]KAI7889465.1 aspartic peptidase domain-containing protein [Mucor mucedo]